MKPRHFLCKWLLLFIMAVSAFSGALAAEGDPLLSVDDLLALEESYSTFLSRLGEVLVEKELLAPEELQTWKNLQMGDFLNNGGYGSILTSFYPGVLDYAQDEDRLIELRAILPVGNLELLTTTRYSPDDNTTSGLILTLSVEDDNGHPMNVRFVLTASDGIFYRWDSVREGYAAAGLTVESDGETVVWTCSVPAAEARNPEIGIQVVSMEDDEELGEAVLSLEIEGTGYRINPGALTVE